MGTDVNASFSGSSSATSGVKSQSSKVLGDFIIGGSKPTAPWLLFGLGALVLVGLTVFLIRK
jgi:hypothetical protein